jgi:molybdate transport system substrate-binding protein
MRRLIVAISVGIALWNTMAVAADVKVLSAGAVEPGLLRAAEQFKRASGNEIKVQFNTAPQLTKRMAEGEVADILIAPPAVLDEQAKNDRISTQGRLMLGRVGAGVVVRASAPNPDIATIETLKQATLSAGSIVYNTASSGLYLDKLFERIGIAKQNQGQDDTIHCERSKRTSKAGWPLAAIRHQAYERLFARGGL